MHIKYLLDKPWEFKLAVWEMVERLQDAYPYYEIGWYGFQPMFIVH